MSSEKKHALTVLASANFHPVEISKLTEVVKEQFAIVARMESESALRAILIGIALHRIKSSLNHGEWMPWQEKHLDVHKSQVNYYMRLSTVFVAKVKLTTPEILALDCKGAGLVPDAGNGIAKRVSERAAEFVGDKSLTELLVKFGIKKIEHGDDPLADATTTRSSGSRAGEQTLIAEIAEYLEGIRQLRKAETVFRLKDKKHADAIRADLHLTMERFDQNYAKAFGKPAR